MARKKIRIAELHRLTCISASTLSRLYNEKTSMISFDTIEKIYLTLDCTVGEFLEVMPD